MAFNLSSLSNWQLISIGFGLAIIYYIISRWKTLGQEFKDEWAKRQARRAEIHQIIHGNPSGKLTEKYNNDLALQILQSGVVGRWLCGVYKAWHHLPPKVRLLLCLPACAALTFAVSVVFFPVILAIRSYDTLGPLTYAAQFIPIAAFYISIYLFMARYRFIISWFVAFNFLLFGIMLATHDLQNAGFFAVTYRGFYHCIAVAFIARVWMVSRKNRPGAMLQLLGVILVIIGISNAALSIFIATQTSNTAHQDTVHVMASPLYQSFEPLLRQMMTPLHLQIGDFVPETICLSVLLFAWGGLFFGLGGIIMCAKFEDVASIPEDVRTLKLYT